MVQVDYCSCMITRFLSLSKVYTSNSIVVFLDSPALNEQEQPMDEDDQLQNEGTFTSATCSSQLSHPTVPDTDSASKRPRVKAYVHVLHVQTRSTVLLLSHCPIFIIYI